MKFFPFVLLLSILFFTACREELPKVDSKNTLLFMPIKEGTQKIKYKTNSGKVKYLNFSIEQDSLYIPYNDKRIGKDIAVTKGFKAKFEDAENPNKSILIETLFLKTDGVMLNGISIVHNLASCKEKGGTVKEYLFPYRRAYNAFDRLKRMDYSPSFSIDASSFSNVWTSKNAELIWETNHGLVAFLDCNGDLYLYQEDQEWK